MHMISRNVNVTLLSYKLYRQGYLGTVQKFHGYELSRCDQ